MGKNGQNYRNTHLIEKFGIREAISAMTSSNNGSKFDSANVSVRQPNTLVNNFKYYPF